MAQARQTDRSVCSELLNVVVGGGWLQIPNTDRHKYMRKRIITEHEKRELAFVEQR